MVSKILVVILFTVFCQGQAEEIELVFEWKASSMVLEKAVGLLKSETKYCSVEVKCRSDGDEWTGFPGDCSRFCMCSNGRAIQLSCPPGLEWNQKKEICDWPWSAKCAKIPVPEPDEPKSAPEESVPESAVPAPELVVPVPEPAVPVPELAVPIPKSAIPVPELAAPIPEPAVPGQEPAVPVPEPAVPVPEPAVPVPEPALPVPEPAVPVPEPAVPVQEPVVQVSGLEDRVPQAQGLASVSTEPAPEAEG